MVDVSSVLWDNRREKLGQTYHPLARIVKSGCPASSLSMMLPQHLVPRGTTPPLSWIFALTGPERPTSMRAAYGSGGEGGDAVAKAKKAAKKKKK
jgi:hypothetical protein